MKVKEFVKLEKRLLPDLPGFAIKRSLMFMVPVGDILRGIDFDPSGFDKRAFYVEVFAMPLFVPTKYLSFNFGDRLRFAGIDGFDADDPELLGKLKAAIRQDAGASLAQAGAGLEFADLARTKSMGNPHTPKAIAFALARAGRTEEAIGVIDQLLPHLDLESHWQRDIDTLCRTLKAKLLKSPVGAGGLETWKRDCP